VLHVGAGLAAVGRGEHGLVARGARARAPSAAPVAEVEDRRCRRRRRSVSFSPSHSVASSSASLQRPTSRDIDAPPARPTRIAAQQDAAGLGEGARLGDVAGAIAPVALSS
jgi:hypothetical protein